MEKKFAIIAMVPARIGSTRLKMKNLALLNGKPLISYAVEAAKASSAFDRIVINSDNEVFGEIAALQGVEFYLRPNELGSSSAKSDGVVYDFMLKHPCDILAWINPTSPLQTGDEIKNIVQFFIEKNFDSLITVKREQVHSIIEGKPINFKMDEMFAQTQDLVPVETFVYSVMIWKRDTFMPLYEAQGYAVLSGKIGYYPVGKETSIIVKTAKDFQLADYMMRLRYSSKEYDIEYYPIAEEKGANG